jgi:hypothetical protein
MLLRSHFASIGIKASGSSDIDLSTTQPSASEAAPESPWEPIGHRVPAFHIDHNLPSFDAHAIGGTVGAFHVFFVLVLDKSVAARLVATTSIVLFVGFDNLNVLDRAKRFHLA